MAAMVEAGVSKRSVSMMEAGLEAMLEGVMTEMSSIDQVELAAGFHQLAALVSGARATRREMRRVIADDMRMR